MFVEELIQQYGNFKAAVSTSVQFAYILSEQKIHCVSPVLSAAFSSVLLVSVAAA